MSEPPSSPTASRPSVMRERLRLFALVALLVLWIVPTWVRAQVDASVVNETGAIRSGIAAALALIVLWGLCATSLAARSVRGLRIGAALTDALVALATTALLVVKHPWIPGGDLREAWVPIFGPLALLAVLDAIVAARRAAPGLTAPGHAVSVIRAGAALFAACALGIDGQWIPAAIAAWLAVAPLMFLRLQTAHQGRRSLEAFVLGASAIAGLSPWIQKSAVGWHPALEAPLSGPVYLWCVVAAFVVTTAIDGLMRPDADTPAA